MRLALCSRLPISSSSSSAQTRATADAGAELTHAGHEQGRRGQGRAGGEDAREHAGHEQRESRRRSEASQRDDVRGSWGGAYDIVETAPAQADGRRLTAADALRRADELMGVSYR